MLHPPMAFLRNETSLFELLDVQLKPVVAAWVRCFDAVKNESVEAPVLADHGFV